MAQAKVDTNKKSSHHRQKSNELQNNFLADEGLDLS